MVQRLILLVWVVTHINPDTHYVKKMYPTEVRPHVLVFYVQQTAPLESHYEQPFVFENVYIGFLVIRLYFLRLLRLEG